MSHGAPSQATHGCGDLIFSSHTIFALMGALTYHEYGTHLATKVPFLTSQLSLVPCLHAHGAMPTSLPWNKLSPNRCQVGRHDPVSTAWFSMKEYEPAEQEMITGSS